MQASAQTLTISEFQSMLQSEEQESWVSLLQPFISAVTLEDVQQIGLHKAKPDAASFWAGWA